MPERPLGLPCVPDQSLLRPETGNKKAKYSAQPSEGMRNASSLLKELRRLPGEPLNALRDGRVGGKQAAQAHSKQRLDDEQVRR